MEPQGADHRGVRDPLLGAVHGESDSSTTVAEGYAEYLLGDVDLEPHVGRLRRRARWWGHCGPSPPRFTVPGPGAVDAAALTNVTVAPDHRRQGLLTEMITADLRASADRGRASGDPHRLGVPHLRALRLRRRCRGRHLLGGPGGHPLSPAVAGAASVAHRRARRAPDGHEAPGSLRALRAAQPGSIERDARWWDRVLHQVRCPEPKPPEGYQALYRSPDGHAGGIRALPSATQKLGPHAPDRRSSPWKSSSRRPRPPTSACGSTATRSTW